MRYNYDRQRMDEAKRRMWQRHAMQGNQPDKQQVFVKINGEKYLIYERENKLVNDDTVVSSSTVLDDNGRPFSAGTKDFIQCTGCLCRLNASVQDVYICRYCQKISCAKHTIHWQRKNISFCRRGRCYFFARLSQVMVGLGVVTAFFITHIFGVRFENAEEEPPIFTFTPEEIERIQQQHLIDPRNQYDIRRQDEDYRP